MSASLYLDQMVFKENVLEREKCHVCDPDRLRRGRAVAVGLSVCGHQTGRDAVSAAVFPRAALPGHRTVACFLRQNTFARTVWSDRIDFSFPRRTELRAVLCRPRAWLGKHV